MGSKTMKAAVLTKIDSKLELLDLDYKEPEYGQVLVKILYSGICGKQLEEIDGKRPDKYIPHLLGHEGSGIVIKVGPGVTKVYPGDHVVLSWIKGYGINSDTPTYRDKSKSYNAGCITTFNEYALISENRLTSIRKDFPMDVAALLGCCVPTGFGAIAYESKIRRGQSVAIFGMGGVGLSAVIAARVKGCKPIIAVDLSRDRLELASQFGATHLVDASKNIVARVIREFLSSGVDYSFETSGSLKAMEDAWKSTRYNGTVCILGVPPSNGKMCIDPHELHSGKKLIGSSGGGTRLDIDIPIYCELYLEGKLPIDKLITHRYKLDDINKAIDMARSGKAGRVLLEIGNEVS